MYLQTEKKETKTMAYFTQEMKKELAPGIKKVLNKYGMKATLGVRHHSTLVCRIKKGKLDLAKDSADGTLHYQVNHYWTDRHYTGKSKQFFRELIAAMKGDKWYDRSDSMTDYFDTAYYLDVQTGDYSVPYEKI